mmetsp:Transcript_143662/g.374181  ORF Transcript_143662/g.374181 Transcript_143662/m.374181 type:complete len:305 (+) Transcript_143662:56-970(+)
MGDGDLLWHAVSEAVRPIAHLEVQYESDKLEKKIRDYFKKGAKGISFHSKPWDQLINDYADAVFSSIFAGLGDREWLPQADFLFCVDAGVKEHFPGHLLSRVPQQAFEQCVLQATDRAFDEQRYWTYRWDTIQKVITGKMTQKKVREALDAARAETVQAGMENVGAFVSAWIAATVRLLATATQGDPRGCIEEQTACALFHALIQEGALPIQLVNEEGLPPVGWPGVDSMVTQAYSEFGAGEHEAATPCKGRGNGKGCKGKNTSFGKNGQSMFTLWNQVEGGCSGEPPAKRCKGGGASRNFAWG